MKIIEICSDINNIDGGEGTYAKRLIEALGNSAEVEAVYTEQLFFKTKHIKAGASSVILALKKLVSFELSRTFLRVYKKVKSDDIDCVILESLFQDRNPLLLVFYGMLLRAAHKHKTLIAFSLHEFFRLEKMKFGYNKLMCEKLAMGSDILFVTEKNIYDYFTAYKQAVFIRDIPSNILFDWASSRKALDKKKFVYFGRVSADKSFETMIKEWRIFNKEGLYSLDILTSSEVSIESAEEYNITIKRNLTNEQISKEMKDKAFCLLPITPFISDNNTTFKTSLNAGCITIGCFSEKFVDLPFVISLSSYDDEDFLKGLKEAVSITNESLLAKSKAAISFGENYSYKRTAEQIISAIQIVKQQKGVSQ